MTNEYYDAVISYKLAMTLVKKMFLKGLLTPEEYGIIETKMCQKYGINSCSIYRENDWIYTKTRGNMSPERMVI